MFNAPTVLDHQGLKCEFVDQKRYTLRDKEIFQWAVALFRLLEQSPTFAERICPNFKFVTDENVIPNHAQGHVFKTSTVDKVTHCHMLC